MKGNINVRFGTEFSLHGTNDTTSTPVTWALEMGKTGLHTYLVGPWGII